MTQPARSARNSRLTPLLWTALGLSALGLLLARAIYADILILTIVAAAGLIVSAALLIRDNMQSLRGRSAAYGLNSVVTVLLVIAIVGVVNFLGSRYPQKLDLTQSKKHTLSDQTVKLIKGLSKPVKAVLFGKAQQNEQFRPLLDNYKALNPKFETEYVDPDREPTRAKSAGIKKYGTLLLQVGAKENKVEEPNEEKLTNALLKLLKDKVITLCPITGHGEKNFGSPEADGYDGAKKALMSEAYDVRDVNLVQEGRIHAACDAIAVVGPTKSFFEPETKLVREYLAGGGRAIFALDVNLKGGEYAPELLPLLADWYVKPSAAMIVDPLSKMLGVDAAVPILAAYQKEHAITRDFQTNSYFPFARPLEIATGVPAGVTAQWLAQTTPKSWAVFDLREFATGQVRFTEGKDKMGPLTAAVAVSGKAKDSKAPRDTRLVVFGTSQFATNNYARYGGNQDFFLNAVAWVMEDESLISIRAKEDAPGKVELSQKQGTFIFLLTVLIVPILVAVAGIVFWVLRRRL